MAKSLEVLELERSLLELEDLHASFDYLRISIASPTKIKSWAERALPSGEIVGEVTRPETINFRTHQPEVYGLFCEKIFGPIKNWKCRCGKYNGFAVDTICDDCQVEITEARVRRYRMGYIELTCPVMHNWYLKGTPSYISILLRPFDHATVENVSMIVYLEKPKFPKTKDDLILREFAEKRNVHQLLQSQTVEKSEKRKGSEIIKAALETLDLQVQIEKIRVQLACQAKLFAEEPQTKDKTLLRLRIFESFYATGTAPEWMILTTLPILPPNLRPLVELESGRLVAADVNELYRLIITRNQRLYDFLYRFVAPDLIGTQGRRLLQEGVDSLIDNSRVAKKK
jgi:DNA-directed RNA polymerase subunit beta'